jgi:4-carboxymuconolactone decarboxylase
MTASDTEKSPDQPPAAEGIRSATSAESITRGLAMMDRVYWPGFSDSLPAERSPMLDYTIGHLFGDIWTREGLSVRDRRLLVLGVTAALGRADLLETQAKGALIQGELTPEELREAVLHLHFFVGWGNGTMLDRGVEAAIASVQNDDTTA